MLWVFKKFLVFMFLVFRLDSNKQNWPSRNGFKCSKLLNKHSLLLPQPVHLTRQDPLRMKKMMMISEIHQLRFCFLYKCSPCTRKQWKKCLSVILYASWWTCHWYLGMSAIDFHLLCAIHVKTVSLNNWKFKVQYNINFEFLMVFMRF